MTQDTIQRAAILAAFAATPRPKRITFPGGRARLGDRVQLVVAQPTQGPDGGWWVAWLIIDRHTDACQWVRLGSHWGREFAKDIAREAAVEYFDAAQGVPAA